jgi:hypothetical protein
MRRLTLDYDGNFRLYSLNMTSGNWSVASVFREFRDAFKPEASWLVLPGKTPKKATLFSLADRRSATVHAPYPALRGRAVIGSSLRWLTTADDRGRMSLVNPVTGDQRSLPAITTIPDIDARSGGSTFVFWLKSFSRGPPYAGGREPCGTFTLTAEQMRCHLYRKVVLSDSPGVGGHGAAMLITGELFGVAAFVTTEDAVWRLAPSRDGVEDAIHYDGRFYSVTYTGAVEVWECDPYTGVFTSAVVTPRLDDGGGDLSCHRKYLVAAPGGRLMLVLKDWKETGGRNTGRWTCSLGPTSLFACRQGYTRSSRPATSTAPRTILVTRDTAAATSTGMLSGCSA